MFELLLTLKTIWGRGHYSQKRTRELKSRHFCNCENFAAHAQNEL